MTGSRRLKSFSLAMVFLLVSIFPVRNANAVIPLAVGFALRLAGPTGIDLLTAGVTHLIGGSILALGMYPTSTSDGTYNFPVRVPVVSGDAASAVMPPPAAPATAPFGGTAPPEGTTDPTASGYRNPSYGGKVYKTPLDACKAYLVSEEMITHSCYECRIIETGSFAGTGTCHIYNTHSAEDDQTDLPKVGNPGCPSGYIASQSSATGCALSDPRAVTADYLADFRRNGQQYTFADVDGLPPYVTNGNNTVGYSGTDSQGRPAVVAITANADGTATIQTYTQGGTAQIPVVNKQTVAVSPSGAVTSATATTVPGSIVLPTAANTPAVVPGAAAGGGTGTGTGDIVFPSDYARAGEADLAAQAIKSSVDALKDKLTDSVSIADPVVPSWVDPWGETFSGLKGWQLPSHASTCPVSSFEFSGRLFVFSSHCQIIADHWGLLNGVMVVVWTVVALFVVLGA